MNPPVTSLQVTHRCGCVKTIRVNGPKETLAGIAAQLATEPCRSADCPRKQARRGYKAPARG